MSDERGGALRPIPGPGGGFGVTLKVDIGRAASWHPGDHPSVGEAGELRLAWGAAIPHIIFAPGTWLECRWAPKKAVEE